MSDELKFPAELYEAHKGKLLCHIEERDDALADNELQTTLGLFNQYRSRISEESNRNVFFDNEQGVYDVAVDFAYSRVGDARRAFEYSEASRARSLLDLTSTSTRITSRNSRQDVQVSSVTQPLSISDIQAGMPEQSQIVQYALLSDKLLIFVLSKTYLFTAATTISQEELSEKVELYRQLASQPSGNQAESAEQAERLYDYLIKPVEEFLDRNKYLCIVADKCLNYVPFGALRSSASGRFVVRDYLIGSAPSSTLFVKGTEVARSKGESRERLFSIGNPRFNRAAFPSLPDLPSSALEARRITTFYDSSTALVGGDADEPRVRGALPGYEIIHFAMHYVVDEYSPMLSKFLLAKPRIQSSNDQASDGLLQPFEIYAMKLPRARLIVLSACQTGIERTYKGEGAINVARPFISAGVPLVVASLWRVDSDSTADLLIDFHKLRKRSGLSTAMALRAAQLEMIDSADERFHHPYYWAPFVLIGGYATF